MVLQRILLTGALAAGTTSLVNCHRGHSSADTIPAVAADTARGTIRVVGNMPFPQVILAVPGAPSLALADNAQRELLKGLSGVELMVTGKLTDEKSPMASPGGARVFRVDQFAVRAVDGVPAHDGVLEVIGGVLSLRMASGEQHALKEIPPRLREMVGARVYLVGSLDQAPASYGVITRAP